MEDQLKPLNQEVSLDKFIKNNDKLLSVMGVFIAVVALTENSANWALKLVSFASMAGVVVVGWEVWSKLRNIKMSLRLIIFSYILSWGGFSFIIYWLYRFRPLWDVILWFPAWLAIFTLLLLNLFPIVRKFSFTRWIFGIKVEKRSIYQKLSRIVAMSVLVIVTFIGGVWLATGTNLIFDLISRAINK